MWATVPSALLSPVLTSILCRSFLSFLSLAGAFPRALLPRGKHPFCPGRHGWACRVLPSFMKEPRDLSQVAEPPQVGGTLCLLLNAAVAHRVGAWLSLACSSLSHGLFGTGVVHSEHLPHLERGWAVMPKDVQLLPGRRLSTIYFSFPHSHVQAFVSRESSRSPVPPITALYHSPNAWI